MPIEGHSKWRNVLFPCSYDQINLAAGKGHLVSINAICVTDRNSAEIPDISLSLRTKISFVNSENKAKRVMSLYGGGAGARNHFSERRNNLQGNSEHWAPCADRLVSHTICNSSLFHLQAASIISNSFTLQLKMCTVTFEESCYYFTWQLLW